MLSANDGGLQLTTSFNSDSVKWRSRNSGYVTSQFFTIALSQEPDDIIIGGMQDNGTDLSVGSLVWTGVLSGDGGYAETTRNKKFWFSSSQGGRTYLLTLDDRYRLSSYTRVDPEPLVIEEEGEFLFINPFVVDPVNPNRMFLAGGSYLYVNDNVSQLRAGTQIPSSTGWKQIRRTRIREGSISTLEIASDGSVVYVGSTNGTLLRIDNADQNNRLVVDNITRTNLPSGFVSSISINPADTDHILVTFSNYEIISIFESRDGGATFRNISGNLEEFPDGSGNGPSIRWGEIVPLNEGILYLVGTSTGLYSSRNDGGRTIWLKESPDLIGSAVVPMMDYRPSDGRLAIATHGNGVFTSTIEDFKQIKTQENTTGEPFRVISAFPNPFKNMVDIRYEIPKDGVVRIDIYSIQGKYIRNLLWAYQYAGPNSVTWDGTNASSFPVTNGTYMYRILYGNETKGGRISVY